MYRFVKKFVLEPTTLQDTPTQEISFYLPEADFLDRPRQEEAFVPGAPPTWMVDESSLTFRLRLSAGELQNFASAHDWVVANNIWPDGLVFKLNENYLEERRNLHHGRYLPIDITRLLKKSDNKLKVYYNNHGNEGRPFHYVLGIEAAAFIGHSSLLATVPTISVEECLAAIRTKLATDPHVDDDLEVISENMTVKMFEPYSGARIFDIPVRGAACTHQECFDLEVFLRSCKRVRPDQPTIVDCWRCPWCKGDVRPQTLVIDGFLLQIRRDLEAMNALDTRAIVIEVDGSWKRKEEDKAGTNGGNTSMKDREYVAGPATSAKAISTGSMQNAVEVIEHD